MLSLLHEQECRFYTYLFCCTEMRSMFIISTVIWVTGSGASRARANLLVQNVIELEFELSRMSMKPTIEKMMHAKYLSEVRGGNKRIPQCHIQKDWQDYLFAIVQFFLCVYLRATIVSSSEILGTRILSISAAHIGALRHLLLNFQTKNLSKMTHFVGEDFKRIWEKYEELFISTENYEGKNTPFNSPK